MHYFFAIFALSDYIWEKERIVFLVNYDSNMIVDEVAFNIWNDHKIVIHLTKIPFSVQSALQLPSELAVGIGRMVSMIPGALSYLRKASFSQRSLYN